MRPLLLALLLVAPLAQAQVAEELLSVQIEPFRGDVKPLQGIVITNVTIRVACALAGPDGLVTVDVSTSPTPPWATVLLLPPQHRAPVTSCVGTHLTFVSQLALTASEQAPAFQLTPIIVTATAGPPDPARRTAAASVEFRAGGYVILDVQAAETQKRAPSGAEVTFPLKATNLGNGPVQVTSTVEQVTGGLEVEAPAPFALESRQQGGSAISQDLVIRVRIPEESDGGMFTLRVVASMPQSDAPTDEAVQTFTVGRADAGGWQAAWLAPLALAVVAWGRRR